MKLIIDVPDNIIEDAKSSPNYYPIYHFEKMWRAIINGTPLDDIRAEIKQRPYEIANDSVIQGMKYERAEILDIIDKHIAGK